MKILSAFLVIIAGLESSTLPIACANEDEAIWQWLSSQARQIDVDRLSETTALYTLLEVAEECHRLERNELAGEFQSRAEAIARTDERKRYHRRLVDYAINVGRLDLAEEYANEAGSSKNPLLDKIDIAKYQRGDKDAVKSYPREELDLFNALDLANAYIDAGDYEAAEEFVTDIVISEENDPRAATAMTFENIAKRCRDEGDMTSAKRYMDKAEEIGGNLFYTGYTIRAAHRAMHGILTENLDEFAQLGANHRGHHGRELVQVVIRELYENGNYSEARRITKFLDDPDDVQRALRYIAVHQAEQGDVKAALDAISQIENRLHRYSALVSIARVHWKNGDTDKAWAIANSVYDRRSELEDADAERFVQGLASLFGLLHSQNEIETLVAEVPDPDIRAKLILSAMTGYADSKDKS